MTTATPPIQQAKRAAFLEQLAQLGNITAAAEAVGIDRVTAYRWRDADPEFAEAWADALEQAADRIELEARRRAVEGVDEPVFYQGTQCGTVRKYSDSLMGLLLRAHKPEKYADRNKTELTGANGGPVVLSDTERAAKIQALLAAAQSRKAVDAGDTDVSDLI